MSDYTIRGQVLQVADNSILVYLSGLMDDIQSDWIPIPPTIPDWAKTENGPVFRILVDIDDPTELTFEYIRQNLNCLKRFFCRPVPVTTDYLFDQTLNA